MNRQDGGAAFPARYHDVISLWPADDPSAVETQAVDVVDRGMSLRDYFAAKVMQALLSGGLSVPLPTRENVAADAYDMADAMLKARSDATGDRP